MERRGYRWKLWLYVDLELERLQKEKEEAMAQAQEYAGAFGNVQKDDPDGNEGGDE